MSDDKWQLALRSSPFCVSANTASRACFIECCCWSCGLTEKYRTGCCSSVLPYDKKIIRIEDLLKRVRLCRCFEARLYNLLRALPVNIQMRFHSLDWILYNNCLVNEYRLIVSVNAEFSRKRRFNGSKRYCRGFLCIVPLYESLNCYFGKRLWKLMMKYVIK